MIKTFKPRPGRLVINSEGELCLDTKDDMRLLNDEELTPPQEKLLAAWEKARVHVNFCKFRVWAELIRKPRLYLSVEFLEVMANKQFWQEVDTFAKRFKATVHLMDEGRAMSGTTDQKERQVDVCTDILGLGTYKLKCLIEEMEKAIDQNPVLAHKWVCVV